ncbi:prophage tail fiber N-terminal domain-containing protein [Salmonella enterica]|nr:hypothetical protein [Salmonella enterica]EJQ7018328.1 prophage tail fiber N-terminal domain-containing protein [Salmonella enterica]EKH0353399.1 prophage tail fiber N-terminal domain-containing protein [Salmonella enterica]ELL1993728.1 prophage tail fiber N-terminal domain-containing protein [Salmonella enterica]ELL2098679.1 prophage tail fiber N-terminal domain-containing protein [Salmonella enterica]
MRTAISLAACCKVALIWRWKNRESGYPPSHAGVITVYDDSKPGTLNDFLGAMTEDDVRPEALRRFEAMVEEVARQASEALRNATAAGQASEQAQTSAGQAAEPQQKYLRQTQQRQQVQQRPAQQPPRHQHRRHPITPPHLIPAHHWRRKAVLLPEQQPPEQKMPQNGQKTSRT